MGRRATHRTPPADNFRHLAGLHVAGAIFFRLLREHIAPNLETERLQNLDIDRLILSKEDAEFLLCQCCLIYECTPVSNTLGNVIISDDVYDCAEPLFEHPHPQLDGFHAGTVNTIMNDDKSEQSVVQHTQSLDNNQPHRARRCGAQRGLTLTRTGSLAGRTVDPFQVLGAPELD
jgi:hypothetical protein